MELSGERSVGRCTGRGNCLSKSQEAAPGPRLSTLTSHPANLPADPTALGQTRLRSNSTGARHSTPRALDASRGHRLRGPKDLAPEKSRAASSGSCMPKSASVSALSLIITAGNIRGRALSLLICLCPF